MAFGYVDYQPTAGKCHQWLDEHVGYQGDDCLIWPFARRETGYGLVHTLGGRKMFAHRVMCIKAHGAPASSEIQSAHSCGNGHNGCVNPRHLRWATAKQNYEDSISHGTARKVAIRSKLCPDDVAEVRRLSSTMGTGEIAKSFGVNRSTIYRILSQRSWPTL